MSVLDEKCMLLVSSKCLSVILLFQDMAKSYIKHVQNIYIHICRTYIEHVQKHNVKEQFSAFKMYGLISVWYRK